MSQWLRKTPRRGSGGRGHSGNLSRLGSTDSGYDSFMLGHLRNMMDHWEEEMVMQQLVGKRDRIRRRHYWKIKNMLS